MIAVASAVITGVFGGVLRDLLCDRVPLVFRQELYASISMVAALVYVGLIWLQVPELWAVPITLVVGFGTRLLAIYFRLGLPVFDYQEIEHRPPGRRRRHPWGRRPRRSRTGRGRVELAGIREDSPMDTTDFGPGPYTVNIEEETLANDNYRRTLWTGSNLQLTLMTIQPGHDIGLEVHDDHDQFLRVEAGKAKVQMGPAEDDLNYTRTVEDDWVVLVPAGTWHNLTNVGDVPLRVYSLYAPPEHVHGTVHKTKEDADNDPHEH